MISVAEAKHIIEQELPPRRAISKRLTDAFGEVLAEDILAPVPSPRFVNSSMDGVAVRWTDIAPAANNTLEIIGESQAGKPFVGEIHDGTAVRISTGAIVPNGYDTIIPVEDLEWPAQAESVRILNAGQAGQYVRLVGDEYKAGDVVLPQGAVLSPARIALAAQLGIREVQVVHAPTVAVLSTGTELVPFDESPNEAEGQIRDSNSVMLQAAIVDSGGVQVMNERVEDNAEKIRICLEQAAAQADIIFTIGGASVGPHDLIKAAAEAIGFERLFWRIRQKPGKPLYFAKNARTGQLMFGLPGNPVSVLMCYLQYVHPVIQYLSGRTFAWKQVQGRLSRELVNTHKRTEFLRVKLKYDDAEVGQMDIPIPTVYPLAKQESYMITSVTEADGFIFLDIDAEISAGALVDVFLF